MIWAIKWVLRRIPFARNVNVIDSVMKFMLIYLQYRKPKRRTMTSTTRIRVKSQRQLNDSSFSTEKREEKQMLLKVGNSYNQQHEIARYLMRNMSRSFLSLPPPPQLSFPELKRILIKKSKYENNQGKKLISVQQIFLNKPCQFIKTLKLQQNPTYSLIGGLKTFFKFLPFRFSFSFAFVQ